MQTNFYICTRSHPLSQGTKHCVATSSETSRSQARRTGVWCAWSWTDNLASTHIATPMASWCSGAVE